MDAGSSSDQTVAAARRVARNTVARAVAELVAKFASLGLITVLSRTSGPGGLGVLIFAMAWGEITITPIDMGYDRYFLRLVAGNRNEIDRCFYSVIVLKCRRTAPVLALSWGLLLVIGYSSQTRLAAVLMTLSYLLDAMTRTIVAAFNGVERGDLVGVTLAVQRITNAAVGIALLLIGFHVIAVVVVYIGASALALGLAFTLLARRVARPRRHLPADARRDLRRHSLSFAGQDLLSAGIAKLDAILLSLFASTVVVGYYGAAYRLLEATLFVPAALQGAYSAMYTYLHHSSTPSIRAAFQRSIAMLLIPLVPATALMLTLPGTMLHLLFGAGFAPGIGAVRFLGLTVIPLGLIMLASSLISSRMNPRLLVRHFLVGLAVNVALNLALIPILHATGAALAMFASQLVLAVLMLRPSLQEVGGIHLAQSVLGPVGAGLLMAGVMAALHTTTALAIPAGTAVYVAALVLLQRRFAPADYSFLADELRARIPLARRLGAKA